MKDKRLEAEYRPTQWKNYVGNKSIVKKLRTIEEKGFYKMPCILLAGPPGCGKSLAIEILARNLRKKTKYMIFESLNASDKRKLDDIRDLKAIAEKSNPKIIFMDEFDSVTQKAQEALRVIMEHEDYAKTRWCISCNNPESIIPAIQSRCAIFRFENHSLATIAEFLIEILDKEGIEYDLDDSEFQVAILELIESRKYDLRGCINQLSTIITEDGTLTLEGVVKRIPVDQVGKILMKAYDDDLKGAITMLDELLVQKNHDYRGFLKTWMQTTGKIQDVDHAKRIYMALSGYSHRCNIGQKPRNHLIPFLSFVSLLKHVTG